MTDATDVIPREERSPELKPFLFHVAREVSRVMVADRSMIRPNRQLLYLIAPWIFTGAVAEANRAEFAELKEKLTELKFDGATIVAKLNEILARDKHLRECCAGFDILLARFLDEFVLEGLLLAFLVIETLEEAEKAWLGFEKLTYENGRFRRYAFSHLYNFPATGESVAIAGVKIQRLPRVASDILLGSAAVAAVQPLLQPEHVSDFFIVAQQDGPCPDLDVWLTQKRAEALEFVQMLQYYKDGVVHATYTIPYLNPPWVNRIWRRHLHAIGDGRLGHYRDGTAPYGLTVEDVLEVQRWWRVYSSDPVRVRMSDHRNKFRQMLLRAGEYYESSLRREKGPERLIDLAISLESMFTPASARTDLTLRIAQGAAQLVGSSASERLAIFRSLKQLYGRRSALFHGQYDVAEYAKGQFVTTDELEAWSSVIRRAVARMTVTYLRGMNDHDVLLRQLAEAALDSSIAETIRTSSDVSRFIAEHLD